MKKYLIYSLLIACIAFFASCGGNKTQETVVQSNDANGEPDTINVYNTQEDTENFIRVTANGVDKEFKFLDLSTGPYHSTIQTKADGSFINIGFSRGSNKDMREKINIVIVNHNLAQASFPYTAPTKEAGKTISMVYEVKKSNTPIMYSNSNNFELTITSFKDDVIEGTFSGEVTNAGKKTIKIEKGEFKIKLNRSEIAS